MADGKSKAQSNEIPHQKLPQYTTVEVRKAVEAIRLLIKVRDRCRQQGLIKW